MNRKLTVLLVSTALVAGTTTFALGQAAGDSADVASVCVQKDSGLVRMLTDAKPACGPSEQAGHWTIGGELTSIQAGSGLIASEEHGVVDLDVDTDVVQERVTASCDDGGAISAIGRGGFVTCTDGAGGGKTIAAFNDGPGAIEPDGPAGGSLELPAGKYAIFAKMWVSAPFNNDTHVSCTLDTGVDSDKTAVFLSHREEGPNPSASMSFMVVHNFTDVGRVGLFCWDSDHLNGTTFFGNATWHDIKIIAIETSSLSNVFMGG